MVASPRRLLRAFTLIEMLLVMVVLAMLLTLSVPRYFSSLDKSRDVVLAENLRVTRIGIDRFLADRGRYPESLEELVEAKYLSALPWDPVLESQTNWVLIPPPSGENGRVADLRSAAPGNGKSGKPYADY
ncbi:MAG TPA: type II secretion system protein [Burkholderiaceae bacterium]|nr:type II secretion system protein [Burkholderiaceae bacterium]